MGINLGEINKKNQEQQNKNYVNVGSLKISKISTNTNNENKWYKNFVKSSDLFEDGYDFGDLTKTGINTLVHNTANIVKGVGDITDAAGKFVAGATATAADVLGYSDYANRVKNNIAGKNEKLENLKQKYTVSGLSEKVSNATQKNSVVGELGNEIMQGVGYYGGMAALQSVGVPWQVTSGVTSVGNELSEAYSNNATNQQAWLSAGISAGAEIGSEYLFGGVKLPGTGKTTGTILDKVTSKIKNNALKYITQAGINIAGEGAEEVISGIGSALGKQATYMSDKELNEIYSNEDKLKDFIIGAAVSAISMDSNTQTYKNIKNGKSLLTDEDINTNNPNILPINNSVATATQQATQNNKINLPIKEITNTQNSIYQFNKTDNTKINNLRASASKYFNNTEATQNLVSVAEKLVNDKGYNITFDNNITDKNGNIADGVIEKINGEISIRLNPNSERAGEFLLVHEMTHAIETPEIRNFIQNFAEKNPEYSEAIKGLETIYESTEITGEAVADISANLFGNQEFINSLAMDNSAQAKTIIQKIYEAIKSFLNSFTKEGKEKNFVSKLEKMWREAYRNTTIKQALNNVQNAKFHLSENAMAEVNDALNNPKTDINSMVKLRDFTPKQLVAAGVSDLPMLVRKGHLRENILTITEAKNKGYSTKGKHYHGLGIDTYMNAIDSLDNPIAVYQYTSKGKYSTDNFIVLTEVKDSNNNNIIVPIEIHKKGQYNKVEIDINRIKTTYGRETTNYFENMVKDGNLIEVYKKRSTKLPMQSGNFSTSVKNNIPQSNTKVNSDTSTKYSMPLNQNNTQELDNSSFSLNKNAKQYDDLTKTNYIEYFRKDNGDVKVYLMDSNNNTVNDLTLWSNTNAIKELGENLGNKIYETATNANQRIEIGNNINTLGADTDYFMNHRPSEGYGNASNFEENMPDVFEHPEWYMNLNEKYNREALNSLKKVRNNPNAEMTIYRATIGNKINVGDWVSPSKAYAEYHNKSQFDGKANILEMKVKAKDIQFAGDDINEFGYFPSDSIKYSKYNQSWQEHLDKYYKPTGTRTDMSKIRIPTKEDIQLAKGNIPINENLLNKYSNVKEIFSTEKNNYDGNVNVKSEISELKYFDIDNTNITDLKKMAKDIFIKYNQKNIFENNGNKIVVNKSGINESIEKIYNNRKQRNLAKEHLLVFSDLGDIIENATLVNQTPELKNRENIKLWNYYFDGLKINGELYHLEFDVRSMASGENQYRVQRLEKITKKTGDYDGDTSNKTSVLPPYSQPVSYDNNIPQFKQTVKSDISNNNIRKDIDVIPLKKDVDKSTNVDTTIDTPEKLAEILKEKPTTIDDRDNRLKKLATIKFIDKGYYVDKLARSAKNKELSSKYDYSLLANGIANNIIGNGRVDEKGNKIGKGLYEIFEPIENSGLIDDFSKYIYHKHNVDRMNLTTRYAEENKAIFGDSMTSEMSDKIVKEYETKYPEFEAWAQDIYKYNQANLEMLVKYGVLSSDSLDYYNKKYPHYVPTIRDNAKVKTQMDIFLGKKAKVNNPIKRAKGGNSDIIPLKDAMALRTMQTVNSALRNNFGLELMDTIEVEATKLKQDVDSTVEEINFEDLLTERSKENPATLTVFQNGEKVTFSIPDEIYEALKPSNIYTSKALNKLNNIRRGLLTEYNPTFMITNPLKDIQDGSINSKHPTTFPKNLIEATKQIKNKGMYYKLYIANGGSYETYFNYNTGTNIVPSKIDKIVPLKKISQANEMIEMTPRLAEFISSIEAGDSIETAMYNASEITTNFKRGGDITKTLDRNGVTFLNAGVQGATKQIRNIQEARTEGIKGISKLAVRWSLAGLAPALLMGMIWDDDEDYEELSDYIKNNYYIIGKYDNGQFIRIPKGRVVSVLQKFFQNIIDKADGKKMDIDGFIDLLENNLLPSDPNESSLIAPLKQAMKNETWYGGELVPTRLQNLPDAEQYDESTDSISIWLGKKLNISPYKINYVLDQYAGAIGDYTLPYLTQQAESGSDSFAGKLVAPIKDKFTSDSTLKNQNVTDFYSLSEELTKKSNGSNATDEDKLRNKYINSIKSEISKLYAEKREIQSSNKKDSIKYNESKKIQEKINKLAKKGLNNYEKITIEDGYATVGGKEYYLNKNNEWTKVDTTTIKYKTSKIIDGYKNYMKCNQKITNIKSNYSTVKDRKKAVIKYVNSLNLSVPQKAMLIKLNYNSYDDYNREIIQYVNSQKISITDKEEILKNLGFTIKDGRVYW